MITKRKYSKILEIERDILFNQKSIKISKQHFDFGQSIILKYDDSLNVYTHQNSLENEIGTTNSEFSNPDVVQFSNNDYYIESFSDTHTKTDEQLPNIDNFSAQSEIEITEDENDDRYIFTKNTGGSNEAGNKYATKNTEVYEDEIAYKERLGGDYSAESSFDEDIKAILSGQKQYNEEQKQLVQSATQSYNSNNENSSIAESSKITDNHNNGLRNQEAKNPHAIFESLALSFGNAKSYDLGSFDLDKSFNEIEATIARNEKNEQAKKDSNYPNNPNQIIIENKSDNAQIINGNSESKNNENNFSTPVTNQYDSAQLGLDAMDISEDFSIINENIQKTSNQHLSDNVVQHDQDHICETDQYNQSLSITNISSALNVDPALNDLLSYLQIGYNAFQPVENKYFHRLKELLVFHKIINSIDILDSSNFVDKIKDFQRNVMHQSKPDGIPGENTLFELQKGWANTRGLTLIRTGIRNDNYNGSQIPFVFRSDALTMYNQFYDQIHNQGGVITSAGSFRELIASISAGRSSTSMHYTGLALDLHTASGMQNTSSNPYFVERNGSNSWQLWNRVPTPNGTMQSINAQIYNSSSKTIVPVTVNERAIDFTNIANTNGFKNIGNRSCFPADYMCAEWWHFQCEDVLVPYISQFGTELLTIYNESQLSAHPNIWQNRKKIFKKDWF